MKERPRFRQDHKEFEPTHCMNVKISNYNKSKPILLLACISRRICMIRWRTSIKSLELCK